MRRPAALVCGLGLTAALPACDNPWPAERPQGFTVTYAWSAGMLPHHRTLRVSGLKGTYVAVRNRERTRRAFQLDTAEADRLYAVFKDNRFDRIEVRTVQVYDRGGASIAVSWPGTALDKSNAGRSFVKKAYHADWRAIQAHLDALIAKVAKRPSKSGTNQ